MLVNLTPIVQATTAAWETLIYIATECQARQIEAQGTTWHRTGKKKVLFLPVDVFSELRAPQGLQAPRGRRRVESSEEGFPHFENNILSN